MQPQAVLRGAGVSKSFGGVAAVRHVDFAVRAGEIFGLIGPNGAGKTTLFRLISGVLRPDAGKLFYRDADITGFKPHLVCHLGVCTTHQLARPFSDMTVLENVLVGATFGPGDRRVAGDARQRAHEALELTALSASESSRAGSLTLAQRKRLEIARALATNPAVLLLDEVMAGLNPTETAGTMDMIRHIRDTGVTVLMVEHVMKAIMGLSDRVMVLHHGEKLAEGAPTEVVNDPRVVEAYLGAAGAA